MGEIPKKYRANVEPRFDEIEKWVDEGYTKAEIADLLEISGWSLDDYIKKHPRLAKVFKKDNKWITHILPKLTDIQEWISQGDSVRELCKKLGVSHDSWYRYCKEHEILSELVTLGRSVLCNDVEKSLLKLCNGYEAEELKTTVEETANGKKRTRIEKTKRHIPPSAQAISFFLRNRMPEQYSERKEFIIDTTGVENTRKEMFLNMINDEVIEADYEVQETVEDGFIIEDSFDSESIDSK